MNGPGSQQRLVVALLVLGLAAVGVWLTIEPGKIRSLAWVLLGFFAVRVVILRLRKVHPGSGTLRRVDFATSGDAERQKIRRTPPGVDSLL